MTIFWSPLHTFREDSPEFLAKLSRDCSLAGAKSPLHEMKKTAESKIAWEQVRLNALVFSFVLMG
jgi:hypothetical protein